MYRDDSILKWLKNNRRTLSSRQEKAIGGKQVDTYYQNFNMFKNSLYREFLVTGMD